MPQGQLPEYLNRRLDLAESASFDEYQTIISDEDLGLLDQFNVGNWRRSKHSRLAIRVGLAGRRFDH